MGEKSSRKGPLQKLRDLVIGKWFEKERTTNILFEVKGERHKKDFLSRGDRLS